MNSNLAAANSAACTNTHSKKRTALLSLLVTLLLLIGSIFGAVTVGAVGSSGIKNNGLDDITINIYSGYYKTLAKETSCAYGRGGCAWYASSRASELLGKNLGVHSPANWWNSYASAYGFKKTSTPTAKGFAIFSNHMIVIEKVEGNTVTISEGSNPGASDAAHSYCVIRQVSLSSLKSSYKGQTFKGFIDLGVPENNPPLADTIPENPPAVFVAKGSSDNKWHSYRGEKPDYTYTGIAKGRYGWWRIVSGNVDWYADSVYKNEYGWWKVTKGKVDFGFTGLATNEYGTWYIANGKVDFSYNGELAWNGNNWVITNGKAEVK